MLCQWVPCIRNCLQGRKHTTGIVKGPCVQQRSYTTVSHRPIKGSAGLASRPACRLERRPRLLCSITVSQSHVTPPQPMALVLCPPHGHHQRCSPRTRTLTLRTIRHLQCLHHFCNKIVQIHPPLITSSTRGSVAPRPRRCCRPGLARHDVSTCPLIVAISHRWRVLPFSTQKPRRPTTGQAPCAPSCCARGGGRPPALLRGRPAPAPRNQTRPPSWSGRTGHICVRGTH